MIPSSFPPFDLARLLRTVFAPRGGERLCVLIDLADPRAAQDFAFLADPALTIQRHAHDVFYQGLRRGVARALGLDPAIGFFAYRITGGSNLDLPAEAWAPDGRRVAPETEIYPRYDIVLCISTFSATAPLTAFAKRFGFRGATLHGVNDLILRTGLAVDYDAVSAQAEKLRLGLTRADSVDIEFETHGARHTLRLHLSGQEAQKSHGLCRGPQPDIANLPAGEVYFVPTGADGAFPLRYDDGTHGLMTVRGGRIVAADLLSGHAPTVEAHRRKLAADPATGELGELGFGTQELPVSGRDIQDEKILGTIHVATGRSDHLGGHLTPDKFADASHATHDDILFAPHKTPAIRVVQARLTRGAQREILIEDYRPSAYLRGLLA